VGHKQPGTVPTSFRLFKGVHAVSQGIFHFRQETIEQLEYKANQGPISCVKYFFPREISNHDRDEDHECVKYFQDWRIQDFPEAGREKYLNQYVAHHLRKEFFQQIDFIHVASDLLPENTDSENSKSHQLKKGLREKLECSQFMSKVDVQTSLGRILAKDLMHPKWSKGTQITKEVLKDMKDAGIKDVTVFVRSHISIDESKDSQRHITEELLKSMKDAGIEEATVSVCSHISIDESQGKILAEDVKAKDVQEPVGQESRDSQLYKELLKRMKDTQDFPSNGE